MVLDGLWKSLKAFNDAQKDKAKKKEKYMSELKPESKEMYEYYMLQFPLTATAQGLMEEGDYTLGKKARGGTINEFLESEDEDEEVEDKTESKSSSSKKKKKSTRESHCFVGFFRPMSHCSKTPIKSGLPECSY